MFAPRFISYVLSRKQHPLKNYIVLFNKVQFIQHCGLAPRKLLGMSGSSDDCDKVECQNFWLPGLLNCKRETPEKIFRMLPVAVLEISKWVVRTTSLQYSHVLTSLRGGTHGPCFTSTTTPTDSEERRGQCEGELACFGTKLQGKQYAKRFQNQNLRQHVGFLYGHFFVAKAPVVHAKPACRPLPVCSQHLEQSPVPQKPWFMAAGARSPVRTALSLFKMGAPKAGFMGVFEIATGQWTNDTSTTHHI